MDNLTSIHPSIVLATIKFTINAMNYLRVLCGHKIPVCENHPICKRKQNKVITCYGCWFIKNNINNKQTIKFFFENLNKQTEQGFKVAYAMNDTFKYIESCLCVFSYCRDCRC